MITPTKEKLQEIFRPFLDDAPDVVIDRLLKGWNSLEHPIYHPERTLGKHIEIVFKRAKARKNVELVMAAILHDLFKADVNDVSGPRNTSKGWYWSNPMHDEQAHDLVINDPAVRNWIKRNWANPSHVALICKHHMRMKSFMSGMAQESGAMKKNKRIKFVNEIAHVFHLLHEFVYLDDMLNRYK